MSFDKFLKFFPETKLPVSITEDTVSDFERQNDPLPEKLIEDFILPFDEDYDEYTEYTPGLRLSGTKDFQAIVYWKAGLMNYQYVLATFAKGGKPIDRKVIAGTFSDGHSIVRSVAQIDEDFSVNIVSGVAEGSDDQYDAEKNTTVELELLPDGRILELSDD